MTLPDQMSWDQLSKWGDFVDGFGGNTFTNLKAEAEFLPGFVEAIHIENFPADFSTPPKNLRAFADLMTWLMAEIGKVIYGEEITPLSESESRPI